MHCGLIVSCSNFASFVGQLRRLSMLHTSSTVWAGRRTLAWTIHLAISSVCSLSQQVLPRYLSHRWSHVAQVRRLLFDACTPISSSLRRIATLTHCRQYCRSSDTAGGFPFRPNGGNLPTGVLHTSSSSFLSPIAVRRTLRRS